MADLFSLQGKVALVTGASKEMGREVAYTLAEHGADVALTARDARQLEEGAAHIRSMGRKAAAISADLTKIPEIPSIVSRTVDALGGLDILVNVACGGDYSNYGWAMRMTEQMWDNMFNLNVKAPMFLCQAAAKVMKERGGGAIVNISSGAGSGPSPRMSNYGAAKAGLDNLSETLAAEWAQFHIRVNVVISGLVDTTNARTSTFATPDREEHFVKLMPLGRIGKPLDIAAAVLYLVSPAGEWVTGIKVPINGGAGRLRAFG
ncbi:MAG TPA: SDR family oxidoreductase [Candidatus Binataceae bacterium]|jgi:NAD(P)-dependent dehydrogenase (short-subunit alcohol dehydrogenase family)